MGGIEINDETSGQSHAALIAQVFSLFNQGRFDDAVAAFTDDVEVRLPFQDVSTGFWSHLVGPYRLRELFSSFPKLFSRHKLLLDDVLHATDGKRVVARYHGDFVVRKTGKPYLNIYIAVFEFTGDRICSWTEFHNPQVLAKALTS